MPVSWLVSGFINASSACAQNDWTQTKMVKLWGPQIRALLKFRGACDILNIKGCFICLCLIMQLLKNSSPEVSNATS